MTTRRWSTWLMIGSLGFGACTEAAEPETAQAAESTGGEVIVVQVEQQAEPAPPRLLLGHFSTPDGRDGFVLDRTGQPWLVRRDGTTEVIAIFESNRSSDWIEYRGGDIWLRVYGEGWNAGRILYDGPNHTEGVDVIRDADAPRLR